MKLPLKGHVLVFTGDLSIDREEAKNKAVLLGAVVRTSVSGRTTHLVVGSNPGPSKVEKAKALNIPMVSEEHFNKLITQIKCTIEMNGTENTIPKTEEKEFVSPRETGTEDTASENDAKRIIASENGAKRIIASENGAKRIIASENGAKRIIASENGAKRMKANERKIGDYQDSWVNKYRPTKRSELAGNPAAIEQIRQFLRGKTSHSAALISGPPGIGKTTAVHVLCREEKLRCIEFNASDLRNKKNVSLAFAGSTQSNLLSFFSKSKNEKPVVIMDEIDGMTGDRGGLSELVALIKTKKLRVICICNERGNQKFQTLSNYCDEIKFRLLGADSIIPRVREVLRLEGCAIPESIVNAVVMKGKGDMRRILNCLQSLSSSKQFNLEKLSLNDHQRKTLESPFEIASEMFRSKTVDEKTELYFDDYQLCPLFVQENYAKCNFTNLGHFARSADSISFSDLIDAKIHGSAQEWSLMPYHAFFGCVYPTKNLFLRSRLDFPQYLGKLSKQKKNDRLIREFLYTSSLSSDEKDSIMYLFPVLWNYYRLHLTQNDIQKCVDAIRSVGVLKEDLDNIGEIMGEDKIAAPAKTKAALTRECKKQCKPRGQKAFAENNNDKNNDDQNYDEDSA